MNELILRIARAISHGELSDDLDKYLIQIQEGQEEMELCTFDTEKDTEEKAISIASRILFSK